MERGAGDTTTPAVTVYEHYIIDPVTKLPVGPSGSATAPGVVTTIGNRVTYTDRSGTVTAGATAQVLMAANASRRGFLVQNNSSGNLTINSLGTATTAAGIVIAPGQLYEAQETGVPVTAISILGATTGQRFDSREWN